MNKTPWYVWVIVTLVVLFILTVPVMLVDYFADGCIVDYDTIHSRQLPDGSYVWYRGETCHQQIIHTARGKARQTD